MCQSAGSTEIENIAMDFLFCIFSSLHIATSRLSMEKTVFVAERLALYLSDILHTQLQCATL